MMVNNYRGGNAMTRWEEARADKAREQANLDPFNMGIVMPNGFSVADLDSDDKAEVKEEVKAEVKAELKAELKADVKSEVMLDMENRFSELTAKLVEQKKQEQQGSLDLPVDTEDTLQSIKSFDIDEDFQQLNLEKTIKGIMAEVQPQPQVMSPYSYLPYLPYITPQQLQEEQKKREDDERKKKEDEESRLKRERSFPIRFKRFIYKAKNKIITLVKDVIITVVVTVIAYFVLTGLFYELWYFYNNYSTTHDFFETLIKSAKNFDPEFHNFTDAVKKLLFKQ